MIGTESEITNEGSLGMFNYKGMDVEELVGQYTTEHLKATQVLGPVGGSSYNTEDGDVIEEADRLYALGLRTVGPDKKTYYIKALEELHRVNTIN